MQFSSKHFSQTKDRFCRRLPRRLLHKAVNLVPNASFSKKRKHAVSIANLPAKTISLTLGKLDPGAKTNRHRHTYETLLYIVKGSGRTVIENRTVSWSTGDCIYVPVWTWHHHINSGPIEVEYVACENMPLLQNVGELALREEE